MSTLRKVSLGVFLALLAQGCIDMLDLETQLLTCGDGWVEVFEECDDGNRIDGDGCSGACVVETGWDCSGGACQCSERFTGANCDQCAETRFTGANCDQCRVPGGRLNTTACLTWVQSWANKLYFTKTEVTVAQYEACVTAGSCTSSNHETNSSNSYCNYGNASRNDHPMNCVNWSGSDEYCTWVGARLPTEDEWYAEASNNGKRDYPWGDTPQASCSHCVMKDSAEVAGCGYNSTMPVGSKPLGDSVSGLSDLAGNVWEWTATLSRGDRVLRGGSWDNRFEPYLRASARYFYSPATRLSILGFRCVSDTGPQ